MITTPVEIYVPDVTVCFRYVDVIDVKRLNQKYPDLHVRSLENLASNDEITHIVKKIQATVTIEDILLLTPSPETVISGCSIKGPKDFEFEDFSSPKECNAYFTTWKFYLQEYICYRFKRITKEYQDPTPFQYRSISYAIDRSGVMYSVKLSDAHIILARYLKVVIHSSNLNPISSLAMTTNIKRRFDDERKGSGGGDDVKKNYYIFQLTYSQLNMTRLPPPFDTGCKNYVEEGILSSMECRNECLVNKTLSQLKKVPFSVSVWNVTDIIHFMTTYGDVSDDTDKYLASSLAKEKAMMSVLKHQHLTNEDVKNGSLSKLLIQIEDDCHQECKRPDCSDIISLTRGSYDYIRPEYMDNPSKQPMEFEVSVPKKPFIAIEYKEKISQTEFLVYILSCFGVWFGLSVLSLNPFRLTQFILEKTPSLQKAIVIRSNEGKGEPKDYCRSMRMSVQKEIRQEIKAVKQSLAMKVVK